MIYDKLNIVIKKMLFHSVYKSNSRYECIFIHEYIVRTSISMCLQKMEF